MAYYNLASDSWSAFNGPALTAGILRTSVNALLVNNSDLYVGGYFTTAGDTFLSDIGRWDGSAWHALGNGSAVGTDQPVGSLALMNNLLFVGGQFNLAGGVQANRIAKWDITSGAWAALGSGVEKLRTDQTQARGSSSAPNGKSAGMVFSLAISGGDVNVGGDFNYAGAKPANDFSIWHEQSAGPTFTPTTAPTNTTTAVPTNTTTAMPTSSATAQPTGTPGCGLGFSDVASTDYFFEPVHYLVCHGVISGYDDHTFRPYNDTTRDQLAKIVVLGFGAPLYTPATATFSDVSPTNSYFTWVESAAHAGIISGYDDHTFRGQFRVTRGQLSKMVVVAAKWARVTPQQQHFSDVAPDTTFYSYIETAYAHGVISGYSDGTFMPDGFASRAATTKIVYLAIMSH